MFSVLLYLQEQKTPFEMHFGRKPGTKLSNLINAILVDSKDLSVDITCNSSGEITDHLVMSMKKNNYPKYWRLLTFTQRQKPSNTVSNGKNTHYPFTFFKMTTQKARLEANSKVNLK